MRTTKEQLNLLMEITNITRAALDDHMKDVVDGSGDAPEQTLNLVKEFEKEIRKDQTNKCAGSIIGIPKESIHKKEVILAIMGTIEDK